ncbi:MAG TPA: ATP-dependent carboxylate-amine ligase [Terriglobia bacterium]|nr:ATP-dependent carboxylate-amine ligase [Terriglobia bacterium]
MILILTEASDPHADYVAERLRQRGADFVRFDPAQFPSKAELSLSYSANGKMQSRLSAGNEHVDLGRLNSVWYRRPAAAIPHAEITDKLTRDYVEEECKIFMHDTWDSIDCLWLPAPQPVIRKAELKASQLKVAASLGFELPPTLFTNSPEDFLNFYLEHNGNVVSKLPSSSLYRFTGTTFNRYTQVVSRRDVAYAPSVRLCPVIFQAYVPKRVELRITIVGREVFAAEIHSQHSNHTRHDWRRYDRYQTPYFPHELPDDLRQLCIKLVERLGLCYGAIDMVLTPDDRYVFLEINPNGQYLWIEKMTGLPISDAICDLLISGTSKGENND